MTPPTKPYTIQCGASQAKRSCHTRQTRSCPSIEIAMLSRPVLTAKYARPAPRPAAAVKNSPTVPPKTAAGRKRQEARAVHGMRARVAPLLGRNQLDCGRQRGQMVTRLRDGDEPRLPVDGHCERLGRSVEDAVAPLQLRAIDGEVGLV